MFKIKIATPLKIIQIMNLKNFKELYTEKSGICFSLKFRQLSFLYRTLGKSSETGSDPQKHASS